ncbi:MAG: response regulator [Cyanobacteria bacterium P01_F01_bin.86]
MRILLIEDDEILADRLVESLTHQQYVVDAIANGQDGLEYALSATYDLIISDVGLPGIDGISLCSRLRAASCATPILLMTAKDVPDERIRGLDAGADDHLTKPLNLEELHARVRALFRRGEVTPEIILQAGPLRLDPVSCKVTYADIPLKLTPKEYSLLELFLRSPNRVFSRSHIIEHLWSFDDPPLEDSVKAHIKGLRRKLKQAGANDWIENVYGIGYRFTPQIDAPLAPQEATEKSASTPVVTGSSEPLATNDVSHVEQTFQASMVGLWSKYQGLMTQRVDALTQAVDGIQVGDLASDLQADATKAAHKLAGVLGMFEQDEGSDLAREIETLLESNASDSLQQVPPLVQQLIELIQVEPSEAVVEITAETGYSLLISPEGALAEALQNMGQATDIVWQHAQTISEADTILQQAIPDLVVLDIAAASMWSPSLDFLKRLSTYTPSIPTLALTTTDSLLDRVAIAQAGIQRLLTKPVTAAQIWEVATQLHQHSRGLTAQVLVVDDDPLIIKALRPLLEPWGLGVTGLEKPGRFWELLNATHPDLLILDVEMPEFSGIELCQAVRTDPTWQNLPVLFLTAHRDTDTVQQVFRAGADDFICKPIVGPELLTRILNHLERNRLLQTLSHQDAITGLPNYTRSRQTLNQLLAAALTRSLPLSFAVVRLSDLPAMNMQHGHDAGNATLKTWGQCFQAISQNPETMGYWGNGEFVVGLPELTQAEALDYLEPLWQTLRRQIVTLPTGERIQPAFAWAIATYPADGHTLQALYQSAAAKLGSE